MSDDMDLDALEAEFRNGAEPWSPGDGVVIHIPRSLGVGIGRDNVAGVISLRWEDAETGETHLLAIPAVEVLWLSAGMARAAKISIGGETH